MALKEGAYMVAQRKQETCDVYLLQKFLTVIHGDEKVRAADTVTLLQTPKQPCRERVLI